MNTEQTRTTPDPSAVRSSASLVRSTGRDRPEWFALLDERGAAGRPYREIADWLVNEQGISAWWAQKLIVEYEQLRGVRKPGVRPDGSFSVGASRAVAAPAERAYAAFADPALREQWLPGVALRERTVRPGRSARYDWGDGATRISVTIASQGADRCQVAVEHERLADAAAVDDMRAFWQDRLGALKELLEN